MGFDAERLRLVGVAYRILGSRAEAEDAVQDAWLRYQRVEEEPRNLAAWLTTVTSRLALDRLRLAVRRRETYVGPWLPEPVRTDLGEPTADPGGAPGMDPAVAVDRAATLTLGVLVVLDTLSPEDRVVFLMADVFGVPYAEIASTVGRSPEACRKAASRARRRVRSAAPAPGRTSVGWDLAARLAAAVAAGDVDATMALLAPDAELVTDGGPSRHAARRPVRGAPRVTRFLINVTSRLDASDIELVEVNGSLAVVARTAAEPIAVLTADPDDTGRVRAIRLVLAPEKLTGLDRAVVPS
nr:RNA polymerase sigma factor SigJ [Rhabdothermincola salaria]